MLGMSAGTLISENKYLTLGTFLLPSIGKLSVKNHFMACRRGVDLLHA